MPEPGTPNRQPAPKESTIQPAKTESSISSPSNILSKILYHPIVATIGLIASLLGIGTTVYDILRDPDISSDPNPDASQPFAFPFFVKNNSSWFPMKGAQMHCGIERIVMTGNRSLEGFSVVDTSHATIGQGLIVNFRCVAAGAPGRNLVVANPGDILDANVSIFMKYTMLGIPRTSTSTEFIWYARGTPPHWIKGKVVD
jgi:hypothetical protein